MVVGIIRGYKWGYKGVITPITPLITPITPLKGYGGYGGYKWGYGDYNPLITLLITPYNPYNHLLTPLGMQVWLVLLILFVVSADPSGHWRVRLCSDLRSMSRA